mgnify:CR=1 FL=1
MARLHLFLVTRKKAHPAELVGEVNQMVVAAPSRGDALRVHPDAGVRYDEVVEAWVRDLGRAPAEIWPPPNGLKCLRIGVAMPNQGPGPVMVDTVSLPLLTPEHHVDGLLHAWFTAISADDEEECACLTHEIIISESDNLTCKLIIVNGIDITYPTACRRRRIANEATGVA